jgi:hypothetical protein
LSADDGVLGHMSLDGVDPRYSHTASSAYFMVKKPKVHTYLPTYLPMLDALACPLSSSLGRRAQLSPGLLRRRGEARLWPPRLKVRDYSGAARAGLGRQYGRSLPRCGLGTGRVAAVRGGQLPVSVLRRCVHPPMRRYANL